MADSDEKDELQKITIIYLNSFYCISIIYKIPQLKNHNFWICSPLGCYAASIGSYRRFGQPMVPIFKSQEVEEELTVSRKWD